MGTRQHILRVAGAVGLLIGAPGAALAQSNDATLGISYSFFRFLEGADLNLPAGWLVSFAKPIDRRSAISVVGEIAGNYRSEFGETLKVHTYQGGFRLSGRTAPGVYPFAQFLLGGMTSGCCDRSSTNFMIEPGFGVDLAMNRGFSFRGGISLPIGFDDGDAMKAVRLQAGVVLPISSR
jgi:hypothetical protein